MDAGMTKMERFLNDVKGEENGMAATIRKSAVSARKKDRFIRWLALCVFLVCVALYGWNSDDAYHGYIMAKHLAEGKGFVYNVGYRTTASTCPLLTLIQAFVFLFTDNPDVCGLLLGLVFSGLAAWILFFRFCPSPATVLGMLGLTVFSHCFMSFTTSGLENSLLFFLGAVFLDVYCRYPVLGKGRLFLLALLMALLAMSRTDSVLIFIPMAVWAYLVRTRVPFWSRIPVGLAGLSPFVAWTAFSVLYFGFPFPNTYYAKLHTGIPLSDYATSGLWYFVSSWALDPMLLFVPVLFAILVVRTRNRSLIPLFLGLAIYCLYVVSIGGDFMAGRHFTQQFFLSLCGIAFLLGNQMNNPPRTDSTRTEINRPRSFPIVLVVLAAIGLFWSWLIAPTIRKQFLNLKIAISTRRSAVDERAYYLTREPRSASLQAIAAARRGENPREGLCLLSLPSLLAARRAGLSGVCFTDVIMNGATVWECRALDMFLTDDIALPDPLLSHLEVDVSHHWRTGHAKRTLPKGYQLSIGTGRNCIENPSLREYYEKLLLVMTGDLFSRKRLKTIADLNRGRYDHLLSEYELEMKQESAKTKNASFVLSGIWRVISVERDADKAFDLLDHATDADASPLFSSLLQYYRGCVFEDLCGDAKSAESEYEQAVSGDWAIDLVPCVNRLARLKTLRGEYDDAIRLWEKAVRSGGVTRDILWNLAMSYRASDAKAKSTIQRKTLEGQSF